MISGGRRVMLLIPGTMAAGNDKVVSEFIARQDVAWWHWVVDTWIVVDPHDRTPIWWRDQLRTFFGSQHPIQLAAFDLAGGWGAMLPQPALEWLLTTFGGTADIGSLPPSGAPQR